MLTGEPLRGRGCKGVRVVKERSRVWPVALASRQVVCAGRPRGPDANSKALIVPTAIYEKTFMVRDYMR